MNSPGMGVVERVSDRSANRVRPWVLLGLAAVLATLHAGCGGPTCVEGVPCGPVPRYDENQPAPVLTTQRFGAVGLGNWHSCMLDLGGVAWCWGSNESGQLGAASAERCMDGNVDCSSQPLRVEGGRVFTALASSMNHSCALAIDAQAWCWGLGLGGQLGDGQRANSRAPTAVAGTHRFVQVAASLWQGVTCGLKADGSLWCWGIGFGGAAGPAASAEPAPWTQASTLVLRSFGLGEAHACGLDAAGQAWCWGRNTFGELGNGSDVSAAAPTPVAGGRVYRQLSVGPTHACALEPGGQAWCWGFGAAGDGGAIGDARRTPVAVAGGLRFEQIASGQGRSCGLTAAGAAWCWGQGITGALGDGASLDRAVPVAVTGALVYRSIGVGGMATCGIGTDGSASCWGWNEVGALGKPIVAH